MPDNLTPRLIVKQMKAFNGPLVLGSPVIKCGKYPEAPGVCNDHTQFYQWNGSGQPMTKAGDWVRPARRLGCAELIDPSRLRFDQPAPRRSSRTVNDICCSRCSASGPAR